MSAAPAAYSVKNVGVTLPSTGGLLEILRDVNVDVAPGEIVGIVGKSGTGKTTLLRVLSGLLAATTGELTASGTRVSGVPEGVVTVFQDYGQALLPWRTVGRNVELGLEKRFPPAERRKMADDALTMVHLDGRRNDYPWRLSGGMQQRVQIARALALEPRVLLMDEPFGALDALTKASLQDELLQVQARTGATILFITHDIDEAIYLSDRVFVISGSPGTISHEITPGLARPRTQLETRAHPDFLAAREELTKALG
jgi:NitT/TauT family transport system ATP-binding protein